MRVGPLYSLVIGWPSTAGRWATGWTTAHLTSTTPHCSIAATVPARRSRSRRTCCVFVGPACYAPAASSFTRRRRWWTIGRRETTMPRRPGIPPLATTALMRRPRAEIRSAARRRGATVNDLLCCDLFLAIQAFRREMGQRPDAWLRLAVPVDLRTQAHRRMSAANLTGLVFLTRHANACRNPAALLQGIHEEMCQVKEWRLARTFLRGLQIRRHLPGGIAHGVHGSKCQATATMTNVGEIFAGSRLPRKDGRLVAGNLLLDSADFLAPLRPLTCVSLSACTYAGRLSLNLHYDPHGLSEGSAIRLFDTFLGQVRS